MHLEILPHPRHSYGKDVPWLKNVVKKELGSVEAKRIARLEEAYHQFDLEGDDSVGIDEMFALGTEKRRNLTKASADDTMFFTIPEGGTRNGQKTTPWTRLRLYSRSTSYSNDFALTDCQLPKPFGQQM